jgi:hypothetical protein
MLCAHIPAAAPGWPHDSAYSWQRCSKRSYTQKRQHPDRCAWPSRPTRDCYRPARRRSGRRRAAARLRDEAEVGEGQVAEGGHLALVEHEARDGDAEHLQLRERAQRREALVHCLAAVELQVHLGEHGAALSERGERVRERRAARKDLGALKVRARDAGALAQQRLTVRGRIADDQARQRRAHGPRLRVQPARRRVGSRAAQKAAASRWQTTGGATAGKQRRQAGAMGAPAVRVGVLQVEQRALELEVLQVAQLEDLGQEVAVRGTRARARHRQRAQLGRVHDRAADAEVRDAWHAADGHAEQVRVVRHLEQDAVVDGVAGERDRGVACSGTWRQPAGHTNAHRAWH